MIAVPDALEDEIRKRAFAGSDVLLMFMLKGIRPQKWRESRATIPPAELNKLIEVELARDCNAERSRSPGASQLSRGALDSIISSLGNLRTYRPKADHKHFP